MLNGISGIDSNSVLQQEEPKAVLLDEYEIKSQLTPLSRQGEINM